MSYSATVNAASTLMGEEVKNKPRVLIVDDEVDICYLLKGILRYKNIEANYVTTLAEAEAHLQENDPPLIFLDNHLSDGKGMDYVQRIKKEHPSTAIVMITAHDTTLDRERAYKEGVDYFIGKPFTRDIILKTIEKINFSK
jgi:two-component system, OmpR family, response regulator